MPHRCVKLPIRAERDLERGRCAAALVRAGRGSALEAAYAHIEATFSPAMRHAAFKDRVASLIKGGAAHPQAWTRYRRLAERYRAAALEAAIALVERMHRAEIEARASSLRNWSRCARPRLSLMVLEEARLILRFVRRYDPVCFPAILATILAADFSTPAETDAAAGGSRVNCTEDFFALSIS